MTPATSQSVSPARERILDTAFRLFYAHGLRAVGVDTIIAGSGVAKATFYKHFPAKDDLIVAYLDKVDEIWTRQLHDAAANAGPDPADQLATEVVPSSMPPRRQLPAAPSTIARSPTSSRSAAGCATWLAAPARR